MLSGDSLGRPFAARALAQLRERIERDQDGPTWALVVALAFSSALVDGASIVPGSTVIDEASGNVTAKLDAGGNVLDDAGGRVHRTMTLVEDPDDLQKRFGGSSPPSDHYLFEISDVRGVEPLAMPWIRTDALDPWLSRLRALRPW